MPYPPINLFVMHKAIAIVMGSTSDWTVMAHATQLLDRFEVGYTCEVVSAHRTPKRLFAFAQSARDQGYRVIIAGAGGAAHLPGMVASMTTLPVLGVPIPSKHLNGLDSLLSIVQMPRGVPVGTLAIGEAGAVNAAWLALQILAINHDDLAKRLIQSRQQTADEVAQQTLPPSR